MNYSMIFYILSSVLTFEGVFLLLPCIVAFIYGESQGMIYLGVAAASIILGSIARLKKTENKVFYSKEGFVTVSLSWIIISLVGALPFYLTGEIPSSIDAVFEIHTLYPHFSSQYSEFFTFSRNFILLLTNSSKVTGV